MANFSKDFMAISAFASLLKSLKGVNNLDTGSAWKASAIETIKKYFNQPNAFLDLLNNTYFTVKVEVPESDSFWGTNTRTKYEYREHKKEKFKAIIEQILEHIKVHGADFVNVVQPIVMPSPAPEILEPKEKKNWLSNFTNIGLVIASIPSILAIWCGGIWFGVHWEKADKSEEFSKLYNDHKLLERDYRDLQILFDRQKVEKDEDRRKAIKTITRQDFVIDSLTKLVPKPKKHP